MTRTPLFLSDQATVAAISHFASDSLLVAATRKKFLTSVIVQ